MKDFDWILRCAEGPRDYRDYRAVVVSKQCAGISRLQLSLGNRLANKGGAKQEQKFQLILNTHIVFFCQADYRGMIADAEITMYL